MTMCPTNPSAVPPSEPQPLLTTPATRIFLGKDGLRPGWGILLFILLLVTFGSAISVLVRPVLQHLPLDHTAGPSTGITPSRLFLNEGASLLAVLLATLTLARIEQRSFTAYGLGGTRRLPHFVQGLFWGALCLSLLVAVLRFTGYLRFDAVLLHRTAAIQFATLWAIGFTLVSFFEETLLRGYLQATLARGLAAIVEAVSDTPHREAYGFWIAAFLLSFVFGLSHGSNPGESPIGLFAAGCAGLVFCLALRRTGSLWWALGFHAAWDWAQSFLYGVADSGGIIQNRLLATHPVGPPLLSGGLTGPEGSLFVLPTLALVAAIILLTLPRTHWRTQAVRRTD